MSNLGRTIVFAAIAVILIGGFIVYRNWTDTTNEGAASGPPIIQTQSQDGMGPVPSRDYLMAHPDALKKAEKMCVTGSGPGIVDLCDRVHSAEAELLAQKYRNAADAIPVPKGKPR